jgi:hypothetical protein
MLSSSGRFPAINLPHQCPSLSSIAYDDIFQGGRRYPEEGVAPDGAVQREGSAGAVQQQREGLYRIDMIFFPARAGRGELIQRSEQ